MFRDKSHFKNAKDLYIENQKTLQREIIYHPPPQKKKKILEIFYVHGSEESILLRCGF